jgi:hypothetical protein
VTLSKQAYIEKKAAERGLKATISYGQINQDVEVITLTDGKRVYQFVVTGLEMLQNVGEQMHHLLDCRIEEALKIPCKPHFDSINTPISELAQRAAK